MAEKVSRELNPEPPIFPTVADAGKGRKTIRDRYWAFMSFALVGLFGFGARQAIGRVYGSGEAVVLLESLAQSGLYLGSACATASATTLALMLTLIGMVRRDDHDFDNGIYRNIERVAGLATAAFFTSLILLLALAFPVGEFDDMPANWYPIFYEILFGATVIVVALLAATVTMLYRTVVKVIAHITPGDSV